MIRYDLKCSKGHSFDSWFGSSADFDKLMHAEMITCAVCGGTNVEKAIMAPRVSIKENQPLTATPSPAEQAVKDLRAKIEASTDNVGTNFATEARRIHYGDAPERAIIGEAKVEEAKALVEEGVKITPLPWNDRKVN